MSEAVGTHITDQELLSRMRRDDRAAFDRLYERYWAQVYSAAYKRLLILSYRSNASRK